MPVFFFFFNDTATTEIYTLSLHDALPIYEGAMDCVAALLRPGGRAYLTVPYGGRFVTHGKHRSGEHTSELQSQSNLVCRLLLETKTTKSRIRQRKDDKTGVLHHVFIEDCA